MSLHYTSEHRLCDSTKATRQGQRPCNPTLKGKLILRKRDVHVQLWLNQREAETLSHNAERCRLSQSAYLRHLIMGYIPRKAPPLDYHAMMRQLYSVANNLNQIARKSHVLNVIDAQRYDKYAQMAEEVLRKITEAVIAPQRMEKEELLETSTAYEN